MPKTARTRTVKHAFFRYFPTEKENYERAPKIAWQGETIEVPCDYDLEKGDRTGAFYTEEELAAMEIVQDVALEDMTVAALKGLADEKGIELSSSMVKTEIIEEIREHDDSS